MIVVKKFVFNPFIENTYVIYDEETSECGIIDPGCFEPLEEQKLLTYIKERKLKVKFMLNTHCHIDHILGNKFVLDKFSVPFYAPEEDMPLLVNADKQAAAFGMSIEPSPKPDHYLTEFTHLSIGNSHITFLFTPGHTPGEYCLYFKNEKILIAGDVLFKRSIGRTDLWGGSHETLINSIKTKLLVLPDDTVVYTGHGENTSIGEEKRENPFL